MHLHNISKYIFMEKYMYILSAGFQRSCRTELPVIQRIWIHCRIRFQIQTHIIHSAQGVMISLMSLTTGMAVMLTMPVTLYCLSITVDSYLLKSSLSCHGRRLSGYHCHNVPCNSTIFPINSLGTGRINPDLAEWSPVRLCRFRSPKSSRTSSEKENNKFFKYWFSVKTKFMFLISTI
jgi:hypothetical protein